jgi:hypothetical protein
MAISEAWKYGDGKGRLKSEYVSKVTGAIYPVGFSIPFIVELENEARKKKAAAAAKAWSSAQSEASSKAELRQIKAAADYQKAQAEAEAAKKAALAAAAQASAQQGHIAAIKAQTSEIKANTARNIEAQSNPVEFAQGMPAEVKQDVQNAAQASQENAKMQEEINYLPEVQVKSDFSKYLLWGGVAVLAFYLLKKKKG